MRDETSASRSLHLAIQVPSQRPGESHCLTGPAYPLVRVRVTGSQVGARGRARGRAATGAGQQRGQGRAATGTGNGQWATTGNGQQATTGNGQRATGSGQRAVDSAEERMSGNKAAQRDLGHPTQPCWLLLVLDQWFHYNQAVHIQAFIQGRVKVEGH